jgi:uncharacterized protein YndB with AHSA1/START domain
MMAVESSGTAASHELVITRVFDAPRNLVWAAWAERDRMVRWLGPEGFAGDVIRMDARPGGSYRFHMRSPSGTDHWAQGVYHEIVEQERLVYTWGWADAAGNLIRPETLVTVTFADHRGGKTELTLRQSGFPTREACDEHQVGWNSSFDCLAAYLLTVRN